jgi:sulfate/thiosulfate-binding protein
MRSIRPRVTALAVAGLALTFAGCGGGASDEVGGDASAQGDVTSSVALVAFAVPKVGFDELIPAFQATPQGEGVAFRQSYGPSGDQSRKVEAGLRADIVNFSVEPDVTRLVEAGRVDEDWNAGAGKGLPFGSVVTIVVRKGNPLKIRDWDDLLKDGVEVITPNPFSSGAAKWNLLAPYAAKSDGGTNKDAGLGFVDRLIRDHVRLQPKSGREATETFLQGSGDVLLSYENEAIFIERNGEDVEHVTPPHTFKIENPVAVVNDAPNAEKAQAFADFLYTEPAQELWAKAGFRPSDPAVLERFRDDFPEPDVLTTIDDLGGWAAVDEEFFDADNGTVAKIYDETTG